MMQTIYGQIKDKLILLVSLLMLLFLLVIGSVQVEETLEELRNQAEQGHAKAQTDLAVMLLQR